MKQAKPPVLFRRYVHRKSIEGFLFPSLYKFGPKDTAAQLVRLQLAEFSNEWDRLGPIAANANPYEVLTVASMVEREAAVPAERPLDPPADLAHGERPVVVEECRCRHAADGIGSGGVARLD